MSKSISAEAGMLLQFVKWLPKVMCYKGRNDEVCV